MKSEERIVPWRAADCIWMKKTMLAFSVLGSTGSEMPCQTHLEQHSHRGLSFTRSFSYKFVIAPDFILSSVIVAGPVNEREKQTLGIRNEGG